MRNPGLALIVYLTTFLGCILGALGVLIIVGMIVVADVVIGIARSDLRARLRRPRW